MSTTSIQCFTADQRAAREAATARLFERRERSADATEQQELLDRIVELNIEIARGIACRFQHKGVESDDLEQVACLGLTKAARQYRLSADTPFIGYAVPTIRGELKRYFRDCAWTVRIPRRLQEIQGELISKTPQLRQELSREPTVEELADHLGIEVTGIEQARVARGCFSTLSLDRSPTNEGNTLADTVADDEDPAVSQLEAVDMLQPVLSGLCDRDLEILQLRFGEGWTQAQIGREIGVSQMQVSRLLRQILDNLKAALAPATSVA